MTRNLFDNIKERTEAAHGHIEAIEDGLNSVIPTLESIKAALPGSLPKLDAVIVTLAEVGGLAQSVRSEIEAAESHFSEEMERLQDIRNSAVDLRHSHAQLTTIAKHIEYFLDDPLQIRRLLYEYIKAKPQQRKEEIRQWLEGPEGE
jgi:hypothetical protein